MYHYLNYTLAFILSYFMGWKSMFTLVCYSNFNNGVYWRMMAIFLTTWLTCGFGTSLVYVLITLCYLCSIDPPTSAFIGQNTVRSYLALSKEIRDSENPTGPLKVFLMFDKVFMTCLVFVDQLFVTAYIKFRSFRQTVAAYDSQLSMVDNLLSMIFGKVFGIFLRFPFLKQLHESMKKENKKKPKEDLQEAAEMLQIFTELEQVMSSVDGSENFIKMMEELAKAESRTPPQMIPVMDSTDSDSIENIPKTPPQMDETSSSGTMEHIVMEYSDSNDSKKLN